MPNFKKNALKLSLFGLLVCLVLGLVVAVWVIPGKADNKINTDENGIAIKGYDTVAYFTEGRGIMGMPEFEFTWQEARWRFASAANRDLFASDPERYAPQYGGF